MDVMTTDISERAFETYIVAHLVNVHGYRQRLLVSAAR